MNLSLPSPSLPTLRLTELLRPPSTAVSGFAGGVLIAVAGTVSLAYPSPGVFVAWPFVVSGPAGRPSTAMLLFVSVLFYGGAALLLRAWFRLLQQVRDGQLGARPLRSVVAVAALWAVPFVVVAPLCSGDVYSYVAQGQMSAEHLDPYTVGPSSLEAGPVLRAVDPRWRSTPAPYGPVFLAVSEVAAEVPGPQPLMGVLALRLVVLVSMAVTGLSVVGLARIMGRNDALVAGLVLANPLLLVHLVGGIHNEAVMMALLAAGIYAEHRGKRTLAVVLCTLGGLVKAPAFVGLLYLALRSSGPLPARIRHFARTSAVAAATLVAASVVTGLGLGWVAALTVPGTITSWLSLPTVLGQLGGYVSDRLLLPISPDAILGVARTVGLVVGAVLAVLAVSRWRSLGPLAVGVGIAALTIFSPVVHPWYLTWAVPLLALSADRRVRVAVVAVSALGVMATHPLAGEFIDGPEWVRIGIALFAGAVAVVIEPLRDVRRRRTTSLEVGDPAPVPIGA